MLILIHIRGDSLDFQAHLKHTLVMIHSKQLHKTNFRVHAPRRLLKLTVLRQPQAMSPSFSIPYWFIRAASSLLYSLQNSTAFSTYGANPSCRNMGSGFRQDISVNTSCSPSTYNRVDSSRFQEIRDS